MQPDTAGVRAKLAELSELGGHTRAVEQQILAKSMARHDDVNQRLSGDIDDEERARLLEERARLMQVIAKAQHSLGAA